MSDLVITTGDLPDLTVAQIADLPQARLQELDGMLGEMQSWVKVARERMNAALEQRYGLQGRASLTESGRDFGVTHFSDGPLRVTYELTKRIAWDQKKLGEIARKIVAAGDKLENYVDVEFSISETRYNAWPDTLKQPFVEARTVKAGKPGFRLALVGEEAL